MEVSKVLSSVQALAVIVGAVLAVSTYIVQQHNQREARERELRRPYDEKQLALYQEASRIVAHLAATPEVEREKYETRFWELYWGELAFVESRIADETGSEPRPSVEKLMVQFCERHFAAVRCHSATAGPVVKAAIDLSHKASDEIRARWTEPTIPVREPWFQLTIGRRTLLKLD